MTERGVRPAPLCTRGPRYHNDSSRHSDLQEEMEQGLNFQSMEVSPRLNGMAASMEVSSSITL